MRVRVARADRVGGDTVVLTVRPVGTDRLPEWDAGAHVDLHLGNGMIRQYSLCGDPADCGTWSFAVRLDAKSRGGSAWICANARADLELEVSVPRNNFALVPAPAYLFLAGGIGVTPIVALARAAGAAGAQVRVALGGPAPLLTAFSPHFAMDEIAFSAHPAEEGLVPIADLLADTPAGAAVYCCGPAAMIDAVRAAVHARPDLTLRVEQFVADVVDTAGDAPLRVTLAGRGLEIEVRAQESILDALEAHDVFVPSSCREGTCGSCEIAVLDGVPEHRDTVTDPDDLERDGSLMVCVSRARTPHLVLDL